MRVLIACEYSGATKDAFRERGHDAWSCDLDQEPEGRWPEFHLRGDVRQFLADGWDLMIAHPPCTYLTVSANKWMRPEYADRFPTRHADRADALDFVRLLMAAPINRIAVENPVSVISSHIRPADQVVQPYQFGDDASKSTCFWLKNLSPLRPTSYVPPRVDYWQGKPVKRWANQTARGDNILPPSVDRWKIRSATYPGIAAAMADQWGEPDAALPLLQRMTA